MMYSAYDLFKDLREGNKNEFEYYGETFKVSGSWRKITITREKTGQTAYCPFYFGALIDYQGPAAWMQANDGNVVFDQQGNILK